MTLSITETNIKTYNISHTDKCYLAVIMPVYNEGEHIYQNLLETANILGTFVSSYQIIAVNDGSRDNSVQEILRAMEQEPHIALVDSTPNKGKGYAIFAGTHYAVADYIAFLDADLELKPNMLKDFLVTLKQEGADIAIGSKMHKDSHLEYPLVRKIMSLGYYVILKLLFHLNLKDTQTGIKLFRGEIIKPICEDLHTSGFAFDIEILATASLQHRVIIEMPIELEFSRDRKVKSRFSLSTILKVFRDTLQVHREIKNKKRYTRIS